METAKAAFTEYLAASMITGISARITMYIGRMSK